VSADRPEPTLWLPESLRRERTPTLAFWLARGDRLADAAPGRTSAVKEAFEFVGTGVPAAALTRELDARDAAGAIWLRADPAWMMADAVTLRLMACGNLGLTGDESRALAQALKPLFGDAGFPLEASTPSRWYLRCPAGAQLPAFSPPDEALGDDVARHLPQGESGRRWRHLLNEAQVILHNHPLNAARTRRGAAPVNSVWFWGAGRMPDWVRTPFAVVASDDDVVQALAHAANVRSGGLDPVALDGGGSALVDLAAARDAGALERDWFAPIRARIARRECGGVRLAFSGGERHRYRHAHRWRIWRRVPRA